VCKVAGRPASPNPPGGVGHADRLQVADDRACSHEGGRLTLGHALDAHARVEMAVGVLMELCGWDAITPRSRLLPAAVSVGASVEQVAEIILVLGPEDPAH